MNYCWCCCSRLAEWSPLSFNCLLSYSSPFLCLFPAIPQPWHMENVARLLVLCGSNFCYTILANKAINGRLSEVSRLLINIILVRTLTSSLFEKSKSWIKIDEESSSCVSPMQVCERDGYPMIRVVNLVQQICKLFSSASEKFSFIQQLESRFAQITMDFLESSLAGTIFESKLYTLWFLCNLLTSRSLFWNVNQQTVVVIHSILSDWCQMRED